MSVCRVKKNKSKQEIMSQKYLNNVDTFCFTYRNFTIVKNRLKITGFVKKMCHTYVGVKPAEQDQTWALHIACGNCKPTWLRWAKCEKYFGFGFPMD